MTQGEAILTQEKINVRMPDFKTNIEFLDNGDYVIEVQSKETGFTFFTIDTVAFWEELERGIYGTISQKEVDPFDTPDGRRLERMIDWAESEDRYYDKIGDYE